jgi:LuxR family maltose regulon positive regulatory protein
MATIAKTSSPRLAHVYARRRLFRALDAARARRAVWIAGLPGAGKTTLVASWLALRRLRSVWYQVDTGDGDVASFFYDLGRAVRSRRARAHAPAFGPEYRGGLPAFARRFFREVARRVRPPLVLVLDNVQEVPPDAALHEAVAHGIEELPPGMTVVLVSRTDPPPAYARLLAYGAMAELGPDALRLSATEARGIARARRAAVSGARAAALSARADGWAAGLVLLLEHPGADGDAAPRRGAPQALFDFFAGEILARTDPLARDVLLAAALLPRPTAAAAQRVADSDEAPRVLADLARRGWFTFRQAGSDAFQLHPMFRAFLLARARELVPPARLAELRLVAARALEDEGQLDEAVALLAEDARWSEVARIALDHGPGLVATGRGDTLLRWIERAPADALERTPALLRWAGAALLPRSPAEARRWLARAFELCDAEGDRAGAWHAWAAVVETFVWEWSDFRGLDPWIAALDRLQRDGPPPAGDVGARVALAALAALGFHRPNHPALRRWADAAYGIALAEAAPPQARAAAATYLLVVEGWFLGEHARARRVVEALARLSRAPGVDPATAILWRSGEAPYLACTGAAEEARRAIAEALDIARDSGVHVWDFMLRLQAVWAALAADDPVEAAGALERTRLAMSPDRTLQGASWEVAAAHVALRAGDPDRALRHARAGVEASSSAAYPFAELLALLIEARALGATGARADASRPLAAMERIAEATGSAFARHERALAAAAIALGAGDDDAAVAPLAAALAIGRERGIVSHVSFGRAETAELCALALERGVEPAEARRVAAARGCAPPRRARDLAAWPWPVEIRVLGGVELRRGGDGVLAPERIHRRSLELLAVLAALGEEPVPQERVEEALWPEAEGDAAHHALETATWRLRRLLGVPDAIVLRERRIGIRADLCFVDAWAVERLAAHGLRLAARASPAAEPELARAVAAVRALYRGPFAPLAQGLALCTAHARRLTQLVERLLATASARRAAGGAGVPAPTAAARGDGVAARAPEPEAR